MKNTENKTLFKLRFDISSFIVFTIIFVIEVCIALFVNDNIIRPYGGDVLVVVLMYYFAKTFVATRIEWLIFVVLLFAYIVEIGQYFHLVEKLNMQNNRVMRIVIGSSFSWGDIFAYTLGAVVCYVVDVKKIGLNRKKSVPK